MKGFFTFLIVLLVIAVVGGLAFVNFQGEIAEQTLKVKKAEIDLKFLSKLAFSRMLPHEAYVQDAPILFSSYARDLDRIYQLPDYEALRDDDSVRKLYEEEYKKGRKDDRTWQQVNERIDYTQAVYKELTDGNFRPIASAQNNGFRLDIYTMEKTAVDGRDQLKAKVLITGGDPEVTSFGHILMKMKIRGEVEKQVKGKTVVEEVDKIAKIEGGGAPFLLVKEPRKWMPDFIPGVMIGYYNFPLLPPTAEELKLEMGFGVRTPGGHTVSALLEFPIIRIQSDWKLPAGSSFEAEEMEGSAEEMAEFDKKPEEGEAAPQ